MAVVEGINFSAEVSRFTSLKFCRTFEKMFESKSIFNSTLWENHSKLFQRFQDFSAFNFSSSSSPSPFLLSLLNFINYSLCFNPLAATWYLDIRRWRYLHCKRGDEIKHRRRLECLLIRVLSIFSTARTTPSFNSIMERVPLNRVGR